MPDPSLCLCATVWSLRQYPFEEEEWSWETKFSAIEEAGFDGLMSPPLDKLKVHGGPDTVDNGLAIEPTLHKLFDAGAWTLTDDRRILVSANLTGTDETITPIRNLHGEAIRAPLAGAPLISADYIRWHRKSDLGGVFKPPALPL